MLPWVTAIGFVGACSATWTNISAQHLLPSMELKLGCNIETPQLSKWLFFVQNNFDGDVVPTQTRKQISYSSSSPNVHLLRSRQSYQTLPRLNQRQRRSINKLQHGALTTGLNQTPMAQTFSANLPIAHSTRYYYTRSVNAHGTQHCKWWPHQMPNRRWPPLRN